MEPKVPKIYFDPDLNLCYYKSIKKANAMYIMCCLPKASVTITSHDNIRADSAVWELIT